MSALFTNLRGQPNERPAAEGSSGGAVRPYTGVAPESDSAEAAADGDDAPLDAPVMSHTQDDIRAAMTLVNILNPVQPEPLSPEQMEAEHARLLREATRTEDLIEESATRWTQLARRVNHIDFWQGRVSTFDGGAIARFQSRRRRRGTDSPLDSQASSERHRRSEHDFDSPMRDAPAQHGSAPDRHRPLGFPINPNSRGHIPISALLDSPYTSATPTTWATVSPTSTRTTSAPNSAEKALLAAQPTAAPYYADAAVQAGAEMEVDGDTEIETESSSESEEMPPPVAPAATKLRKRAASVAKGEPPQKRKRNISPQFVILIRGGEHKPSDATRSLCQYIKSMAVGTVPDLCPPTDKFDGSFEFLSKLGTVPTSLHLERADEPIVERDLRVSEAEQRLVNCWNGMTIDRYIDGKLRIFLIHRWRTEEDGLHHNIESSQRVCKVDVKFASTLHRWYDSMGLFNQVWRLDNTPPRPEKAIHIPSARDQQGRNGRAGCKTARHYDVTLPDFKIESPFDPFSHSRPPVTTPAGTIIITEDPTESPKPATARSRRRVKAEMVEASQSTPRRSTPRSRKPRVGASKE